MHVGGPTFYSMSLFDRADKRFVWNAHLLEPLTGCPEAVGFMLPVMHGLVGLSKTAVVNGCSTELVLVSRRSAKRAGTRFNRRGIDGAGHVANYVETELIAKAGKYLCSYAQIRGSIPLFWSQTPSLKYKPGIVISDTSDHALACGSHLNQERRRFGDLIAINLISSMGHEARLCQAYAQLVAGTNVRYEYFDFSQECKKLQWGRLAILIDRIIAEVGAQGSFISEYLGDAIQIHSYQRGVVRTNCIDCLDRTNVVQSLIAQRVLQLQLQRMGVLPPSETNANLGPLFESEFKRLWADNADTLAEQYGGSGALKSDYTRTGKRTLFGLLRDGTLSLIRYYRNNFGDGPRQDAIDLLLGNHTVRPGEGISSPSPFDRFQIPKESLVLLTVTVVVLGVLLVAGVGWWDWFGHQRPFWLSVFSAAGALLALLKYRGTDFVSKPVLS